jgi:hypothetical protein
MVIADYALRTHANLDDTKHTVMMTPHEPLLAIFGAHFPKLSCALHVLACLEVFHMLFGHVIAG